MNLFSKIKQFTKSIKKLNNPGATQTGKQFGRLRVTTLIDQNIFPGFCRGRKGLPGRIKICCFWLSGVFFGFDRL